MGCRASLIAAVAIVAVGSATAVSAQTASWRVEPLLRAGAADGPGSLASVFHVEVGPRGEILVAQSRPPLISIFDSAGRFIRTVGRAGQGPGEYQALGRIGWAADSLWAIDAGGRLNLYDSQFEFVRTIRPPMPETGGLIQMYPGPIMADGSILTAPLAFVAVAAAPIMLVSEGESEPRTLTHVALPEPAISIDIGQQMPQSLANPWADHPLWLNTADGSSIVIVERPAATAPEAAAFRILRIGLDGDTILNRGVAYSPIPLDQPARERTYRSTAERISRNREAPLGRVLEAVREGIPAPRFYPPVTELITGADGTLWLRREANQAANAEWDIFDSGANPVGRVSVPAGFRLHAATRDRAWGIVLDELDVPYVQVYAVYGQ